MNAGDRVKTPMTVHSSNRAHKLTSNTGVVTTVGDTYTVVEMDNLNGLRVTFPTRSLEPLDG